MSVVLRMQWSLEAQESHVAVMEHGVIKVLCVSVDSDTRIGRRSVLVSHYPQFHEACLKMKLSHSLWSWSVSFQSRHYLPAMSFQL